MSTKDCPVDTSEMMIIDDIPVSDIDYRDEVVKLSEEAIKTITTTLWCEHINQGWLAYANGYIIGVFLFHIKPTKTGTPHYAWLINGDIPTLIIDARHCENWIAAVDCYIADMQEWVDRVYQGRPIDDSVAHVNVPPEKIWAQRLESRLNMLRQEIEEIKTDH